MRLLGVGLALGCAVTLAWQIKVSAEDSIPLDCLTLLMAAEEAEDADMTIYDTCGFGNEKTAWEQWSAVASEKKMKKALFQLCDRYPQHMYGALYCRKSAQLGYGPALAAVGHLEIEQGNVQAALRFYEQALATQELTREQESGISERMGIYYLTPNSPQYDEEKAMAFLERATLGRSALANNVFGYASFSGSYGLGVNYKRAFEYFWRAILLGCPAAEENLGLFHLARQKKINASVAKRHMERNLRSCAVTAPDKVPEPVFERADCNCETVLEKERRFHSMPYLLAETKENTAVLVAPDGGKSLVRLGEKQPDGYVVKEIRSAAIILTRGKDRLVLNLYRPDDCLEYCRYKQKNPSEVLPVENFSIQPYRLKFTPDECETIRTYAPELVDINLPFVGKTQCAMTDEPSSSAKDPLLQLMEAADAAEQAPAPKKTGLTPTDKLFLHDAGRGLIELNKDE